MSEHFDYVPWKSRRVVGGPLDGQRITADHGVFHQTPFDDHAYVMSADGETYEWRAARWDGPYTVVVLETEGTAYR